MSSCSEFVQDHPRPLFKPALCCTYPEVGGGAINKAFGDLLWPRSGGACSLGLFGVQQTVCTKSLRFKKEQGLQIGRISEARPLLRHAPQASPPANKWDSKSGWKWNQVD